MTDIDLLVAEKIIGWSRYDSYGIGIRWARPGSPPEANTLSLEEAIKEIPKYSSSISDAWEIVEKMRCRAWRFEIMVGPEGYSCACTKGIRVLGHVPYQESAEMAICLAVLEAVEK